MTCLTDEPYHRRRCAPAITLERAGRGLFSDDRARRAHADLHRRAQARSSSEGPGSAGRHAADRARGLRRPARRVDRGPRARSHLARHRRAEGRGRPHRRRHSGLRQRRRRGAPPPARAARQAALPRRRWGACGRRCTERHSTSAGAASSFTRSARSTSRSGTCSGSSSASPSTSCWAASSARRCRRTQAGSLRRRTWMRSPPRRRDGRPTDSAPSSSAFRTARSRESRESAGTSSSSARSSTRWAPTST